MSAEECPHCGAPMVRYKHRLNRGLLRGLVALAARGEEALADLGLDYNDRCNFQKLRYWGLVEKGEKLGRWRMTRLGYAWLSGELKVPDTMWTYRGDPVQPDGQRVAPEDVDATYTTRPEWAREREAKRLDPGYADPVAML